MLSYLYNGDNNQYYRDITCNEIRLNALLGMNITYLGWKENNKRSKHARMAGKLQHVYGFLSNITSFIPNLDLNHTLIFMMDATDVYFQRKYTDFSSFVFDLFFHHKFNRTHPVLNDTNSILYATGIDCFPRGAWCQYEKFIGSKINVSIRHPKPPLHVNSGVWIGKYYSVLQAGKILYDSYMSPQWNGKDPEDQRLVHIYMYKNETPKIELDYHSYISTSMHDVHLNNFILDKNGWKRKDNLIYPMTVHFNGYSKHHVKNFTNGVSRMILNNQTKINGKHLIKTSDGDRMYMNICSEYTQWYYI